MTISRYEAFQAVVESGSLTRAAERLHVTQSGISHAVASLEAELGVSLFTRERSGIVLTGNGEQLLPYVREVLQANERLRQQVAAINGLEIGTVRIGTFATVSSQWLPGIIKEFQASHPAIDIRLLEGYYDDINHWIATGAVDFGFVSLPVDKGFDVLPLKRDKLCCILPGGHPLAQFEQLTFAQLSAEPFIMPMWGRNDEVRRLVAGNKAKLNVKYEVAEDTAIIAMVENGLGISILPAMVLARSLHHVAVVDLAPESYRTIGVALQSMPTVSPAARRLLAFVQVWLRRQGLLDEEPRTL